MPLRPFHPQRGAALAFLALSLGYSMLALRLEDAGLSPIFVLGPRSFPLFVGVAGIVMSIVLLLFDPATAPETGPAPDVAHAAPAPPRGIFGGDWRRTLALCALMLVYAAALPRAGFTLSTAAFLAASFRLLGERRPAMLIGIPVAIAVVILALLRGVFGAHLPEPFLN